MMTLATIVAPRADAAKGGYGLVAGRINACSARSIDASISDPLIVILIHDAKTYDTYNVTADHGTTSFHFDVPVGRYVVTASWLGTKNRRIAVRFGATSRVNLSTACTQSSYHFP